MMQKSKVDVTLDSRGSKYGCPNELGDVEQAIKETLRESSNWKNDRLSGAQKYSLDMMATKMARILVGDPNYDDNWHDIQGYARLIENQIHDSQARDNNES